MKLQYISPECNALQIGTDSALLISSPITLSALFSEPIPEPEGYVIDADEFVW
jgi:hypothetical protein